jgi:hypothetical protein
VVKELNLLFDSTFPLLFSATAGTLCLGFANFFFGALHKRKQTEFIIGYCLKE